MSEALTFDASSFDAQAADFEVALFDRLKFLKSMKAAFEKALAAEGVPAKVAAWMDLLALGATATDSPADDRVVAAVRKLLASPLAEKLIGIVSDLVGDMLAGGASSKSVEAQATVEAAAIPWSLIFMIAKAIFEAIRS